MTTSERLTEPKTNRSRTEVGRLAVELLKSHRQVRATHGESVYDVQFFAADQAGDGMRALLEPKTNRSRAEIGRAIFEFLKSHDEVWIGSGESDYDVQIYANT
jgi:hypothetical protein